MKSRKSNPKPGRYRRSDRNHTSSSGLTCSTDRVFLYIPAQQAVKIGGNLRRIWHLYFLLFLLCLFTKSNAQVKNRRLPAKPVFPLQIVFQNRVDFQVFSLDSTYTNPHGEVFTVKNFRYYLSQFSVMDAKRKWWKLPPQYYLIDERKPESKNITLQIPFQSISAIQFTIGVDSIKNISGVQTGSLDPSNGMFWTWNSGYIFAKLEGTSPASTAPQNGFTYHIGGFRTGENAQRKIVLAVEKPKALSQKQTNTITITANVNAWFAGVNAIRIKEQPFTMSPGKLAMQIADNYAEMFSIQQ